MKAQNFYLNFIQMIKKIYYHMLMVRQSPFRLEEVDLAGKRLVIFCRGTRTFMRASVEDAIFDHNIILNLPSTQACLLGYYYGKFYGTNVDKYVKSLLRRENVGFLLRFTRGRYKIVSLDRNNILTYIDTTSNKVYCELPFVITQQKLIISQFDPSQACYIGVLAGIAAAKQKSKNNNLKPRKVILRLVK